MFPLVTGQIVGQFRVNIKARWDKGQPLGKLVWFLLMANGLTGWKQPSYQLNGLITFHHMNHFHPHFTYVHSLSFHPKNINLVDQEINV